MANRKKRQEYGNTKFWISWEWKELFRQIKSIFIIIKRTIIWWKKKKNKKKSIKIEHIKCNWCWLVVGYKLKRNYLSLSHKYVYLPSIPAAFCKMLAGSIYTCDKIRI